MAAPIISDLLILAVTPLRLKYSAGVSVSCWARKHLQVVYGCQIGAGKSSIHHPMHKQCKWLRVLLCRGGVCTPGDSASELVLRARKSSTTNLIFSSYSIPHPLEL
ncbi:hypothetical protein QUA30_08605 [Microcoleus sp. Pol14C2]|uniref:hypothetical protein n=1 Tax=unclassified Microcoleus TaxID=2642155 RepID=UPI002FD61BC1